MGTATRATPGSSASAIGPVMRRPSSSSSSSDETASGPGDGAREASTTAREGGPVRYAARVEYDGTDFAGFQVQPGRRTVQGELEVALDRISGGERIRVDGAGRTDAGVHAHGAGDRIHLDPAGSRRTSWSWRCGRSLPPDVGIGTLWRVQAGFRPRYAAQRREYRYSIWNGPRSPLRERYALGYRGGAGCRGDGPGRTGPGRAARLLGLRWIAIDNRSGPFTGCGSAGPVGMVTIDVVGDAFLRQMVRSIVAALLRVGRGEATAEDLEAALRSPGRAFAGAIAPPHGLCLQASGARATPDRDRKRMTTGPTRRGHRRSSASGSSSTPTARRSDGSRRRSPVCSRASTSPRMRRTSTRAITSSSSTRRRST